MPRPIEVVALCQQYDLVEWYADHMARHTPWLELKHPRDIAHRDRVRHALTFNPGAEDFTPYTQLEMVTSPGAGVDALLRHPGLAPRIAICRTSSPEQAQMIAGFALWHIVGWQRDMPHYTRANAARRWAPENLVPPSAFPVGILGFGAIGSRLARALKDLAFPVSAFAGRARVEHGIEIHAGPDALAEIARTCRAVVNLLPLTARTHGLLDAHFFAQMREDAILINLGRGGHLVEPDLIAALRDGRPGHAALDVFQTEPLPEDSPLWTDPKITVTPHVAGEADQAGVARLIAENIRAYEAGETPPGLVSRDKGY